MRIIFMPEAYRKFRAYVHMIDYEISGFGRVVKHGEDLVIEDIKIFEQTVNGGHTEMHADGEAGAGYRKFWDDLDRAGEDTSLWKLWWHSHVNMGAYFSGTDKDTINGWDFERPDDNWMLSIVTNKQGKLYCQVDIYQPFRCSLKDLTWDVSYGELENKGLEGVQKDIDEKVTIGRREQWCTQHQKYHGTHKTAQSQDEIIYNGQGLCSVPRYPSLTPARRQELALKYPSLFPTLRQAIMNFEGTSSQSSTSDLQQVGDDYQEDESMWMGEEEYDEYMRYMYGEDYADSLEVNNRADDGGIEEGEVVK